MKHLLTTISTTLLCICTAAIAAASEVRVWGDTSVIDTYDSTRAILTVPPALAGKDVIDLQAGSRYLVALTADKYVYAWGWDSGSGYLTVPPAVQGHAVGLAICSGTVVVLLDTGGLVAWGDDFGQVKSLCPTGSGFTAVGRGYIGGIAWGADGLPTVWGVDAPTVPGGTSVTQAIILRDGVVYRRTDDQEVRSFGAMGFFPALVPPTPAIAATAFSLSVNAKALFAITPAQTVTAWGNDTNGMLSVPSGLGGVIQVAGGITHALAIKNDGSLVGWGTAAGGLAIPSAIGNVRLIAAGQAFSAAVISQAPQSIGWSSGGTVLLGAPAGSEIGRLATTDPDSRDTLFTYALVTGSGDTNNAIATLESGNVVRVAGSLPTSESTLSIRIRSIDPAGLSVENPLVFQVTKAPAQSDKGDGSGSGCGLGGGVASLLGLIGLFLCIWRQRCA